MGYAATTILVYGIRLDSIQAQEVYDHLQETDDLFESDGEISMDPNDSLIEPSVGKFRPRTRYYPNMYSEGTDSRIHDNTYEEGYDHVIGLYVASNGYAYNDLLEDYLVPNEDYTKNYDKYIQPILDSIGIDGRPKMIIINQVW